MPKVTATLEAEDVCKIVAESYNVKLEAVKVEMVAGFDDGHMGYRAPGFKLIVDLGDGRQINAGRRL